MSTRSPRLDLVLLTDADALAVGDLAENFDKIDASPGALISDTFPSTWGNPQIGRVVVQPSTGIAYVYKGGSTFERTSGRGLLATATRISPISTSSATWNADALVPAVVPDVEPGRPLLVLVEAPAAKSSVGICELRLQQDGPAASRMKTWTHRSWVGGGTDPAQEPDPVNAWALWMQSGIGSGTFRFMFRSKPGWGGTITIDASVSDPCTLYVVEL